MFVKAGYNCDEYVECFVNLDHIAMVVPKTGQIVFSDASVLYLTEKDMDSLLVAMESVYGQRQTVGCIPTPRIMS